MAIVEVHDWQVSSGDAAAILRLMEQLGTHWKSAPDTPSYREARAYSPSATRMVLMVEWDSLADAEKWYAALQADPAGQEYFRRLSELVVFSQGAEYWEPLY
jgi:heme-degrading monooxygenase HmoA